MILRHASHLASRFARALCAAGWLSVSSVLAQGLPSAPMVPTGGGGSSIALPLAASQSTFTAPGQSPVDLQTRGLDQVYVGDYGASGSSNSYTTNALLGAGATSLTTTAANDFKCGATSPCQGLLIPLAGDTVSISAPAMTAFRIDGPTIEANGNWTTGATITMSVPGIAPAAGTVVYDITAGCQVGTVSTWPATSLTLTLQAGASCRSITNNDFVAFQTGSQYGPTVPAGGTISNASPNITMSAGPPTEIVTQFNGCISGTALTVKQDATLSGPLYVGMPIFGASAGTQITALGSGVNGAGTYTVNNSQVVGNCATPTYVAMSGPVSATIVVYDVTAGAKLGTLQSWSGAGALALTANSLSSGSSGGAGSTDALAFLDTFAYYAAALDSDHIDANGGHSGGGVGTPTAAVNVSNPVTGVAGCTNCVSVFLGAQNYVSLAITPSAVATATATASFPGAPNTLTQLSIGLTAPCPANAVFGEQVKDTSLSTPAIIGTVYSCSGSNLLLQEGSNAASFGAADNLSFLAPASIVWRSIGAGTADYFVNDADILQFAGFSSTYNDTGFCSTGTCPSHASQIPFNLSMSHVGAAHNDWAVRTLTSIAGNTLNFSPATVNSTGSAQTIWHDDTAAINSAVANNATNGAVIRLPVGTGSGNFFTSAPISAIGTNNIVFQCDGRATDIVASGTGDIFDFVGRKGAQVYGDGVYDCASYNFYRQSAGLAVYASYTNKFQMKNDLFDLGVGGVIANNMTNCAIQGLTLTNMQAEPEIGLVLRANDSSYGQCQHDHVYIQGMTGQNWPDLAVDGVGMDVMGGVATMWSTNIQAERIPGSGIRLSDVNNTTNVPLGMKCTQCSSEFQTGHALDLEAGLKTFFTDPALRSGGYSNFVSCAASATILDAISAQNGGGGGTGALASNEALVISGGHNDGGSGAGVFLNGQQATLNGQEIFSNSVVNQISGQSGVFGPGGTQGNCPGVELGFRSARNNIANNVIGGQFQPNAQAAPVVFDPGSSSNNVDGNTYAGNALNHTVNNSNPGSGNISQCNVGDVVDCGTTLGQSGIPFLVGVETFANNGAYTLTAALDAINASAATTTWALNAPTIPVTNSTGCNNVVNGQYLSDTAYSPPKLIGTVLSCVNGAPGTLTLASGALAASSGSTDALAISPGLYMYAAADTIGATVPAGWYWCAPASTTQGNCYNNSYSTGTPVVPASLTAFSTTGSIASAATLSWSQNAATISVTNSTGCNGVSAGEQVVDTTFSPSRFVGVVSTCANGTPGTLTLTAAGCSAPGSTTGACVASSGATDALSFSTSAPFGNTIAAYSLPISPYQIAVDDGVDVLYNGTVSNGADAKKLSIQYGGTQVNGTSMTTVHTIGCQAGFRNAGLTGTQILLYNPNVGGANASPCGGGVSNAAASLGSLAIDTTTSKNLNVLLSLVTNPPTVNSYARVDSVTVRRSQGLY